MPGVIMQSGPCRVKDKSLRWDSELYLAALVSHEGCGNLGTSCVCPGVWVTLKVVAPAQGMTWRHCFAKIGISVEMLPQKLYSTRLSQRFSDSSRAHLSDVTSCLPIKAATVPPMACLAAMMDASERLASAVLFGSCMGSRARVKVNQHFL